MPAAMISGMVMLEIITRCSGRARVRESRRVRVRRVGACRTNVESVREREFVPP
jgi:hypothetical protein